MTIETEPFRVGQSVRILPGFHQRKAVSDVYRVVRCNELDSKNPSYVLVNDVNHSQRREYHDRLVPITVGENLTTDVFTVRSA
ncbi:hypothetical protein [Mongoliimonas terrestris]|uniref:hypothetical protein n=1 Tax=Mongoliimonas terrestris TaxID=1709001 RepID=UPI0009499FE5|nr:hypothetical protein [Mongoliimonas terrestris]